MFPHTPYRSPILRIALPAIVSNIIVPLLGLADTAIVGHLGSPAYIGAIAVGGMLFNLIYWSFAFLRMGTSGLTAQAYGRNDTLGQNRLLLHVLGIGLMLSVLLIACSRPLADLAFRFIQSTAEVEELARRYFYIGVWGAPAMLSLYGLTGWFIGMQNTRYPMLIAIGQNIVNILCSLTFVYALGMGIEGVASGTVVAQYAGLLFGIACWRHGFSGRSLRMPLRSLADGTQLTRFFRINGDIFLRTLCLVAVTTFFTAAGARFGNVTLAVNALLMQLFLLFSYVMDGFAYAGEALSGRFAGAADYTSLRRTVRRLFGWGAGLTVCFSLAYACGFDAILFLLTDDRSVCQAAREFRLWTLCIPIAGCAAFLFDGIFIGLTATRAMLLAMSVAMLVFFSLYGMLADTWGNHALWCAFVAYLAVRGLVEAIVYFIILPCKSKAEPIF